MRQSSLLPVVSLLAMLLMTLHITDDIVRGISPAGADNLGAVVIFSVWLAGVVLHERRLGQAILLLGGIFAAAMPVLHMRGARYRELAEGDGGFFFVWTLIVVGSIGVLTALLAVHALWRGRRAAVSAAT